MASRPLTEEEIQFILPHFTNLRDRTLFIVAVKTGYRVSELLSLRIENVMQYEQITDTITVSRRNMKGKRESRSVPLHPQAKEALREYVQTLGLYDQKTRLFPITRQHWHRVLKAACRAAKLTGRISSHSTRKYFGMRVYELCGKNVVAAQRALNHKSLASTTHYLSIGQEEIDKAILS